MRIPENARLPVIADIDRDGRNEVVVASTTWNGYPEFLYTVWVFDFGGSNHAPPQWSQLGGSSRRLGSFPAP